MACGRHSPEKCPLSPRPFPKHQNGLFRDLTRQFTWGNLIKIPLKMAFDEVPPSTFVREALFWLIYARDFVILILSFHESVGRYFREVDF